MNIYSPMNLLRLAQSYVEKQKKKTKKNRVEVAHYLSTVLPAGNAPSIVCSVRDTKAEEPA